MGPSLSLALDAARDAERHAASQRAQSHPAIHIDTRWLPEVGCHLQVLHARLQAPRGHVALLAALFYAAPRLASQPWYPGFLSGTSQPLEVALPPDMLRAAHVVSLVNVGLKAPRAYRSLCTEVSLGPDTRVVTLASADAGPPIPAGAVLAHLLPPSGDVFHHDGTHLHWHHLMVSPGVGLSPAWADRWLLRVLRGTGLDTSERATYRSEAEDLTNLLPDLPAFCAAHGVHPLDS